MSRVVQDFPDDRGERRVGVLAGSPRKKAAISPLSERELECLHWVAAGKTDWEIGEILVLSQHTVHEYVEAAKRKLCTRTRIQAVVRALVAGWLQI